MGHHRSPPIPRRDDTPHREACGRMLDLAWGVREYSSTELARWLEMARSSVSDIRHGKKWPPGPDFLYAAALAGIPPGCLLPQDPTSLFSQLVQALAGLTPETQAHLLPVVQSLRALSRPSA